MQEGRNARQGESTLEDGGIETSMTLIFFYGISSFAVEEGKCAEY